MAGETDLDALLAGLDPVLHPETLVWCHGTDVPDGVVAFARIEESEGTTLIVEAATAAAHGLVGEAPSRRIELRVHSSLDAVGLTAAVSAALAARGISANVVAAYHHDHVLVPAAAADRALAALRALSRPGAPWQPMFDHEVSIDLRPGSLVGVRKVEWCDVRLRAAWAGMTVDEVDAWYPEDLVALEAAFRGLAAGGAGPYRVEAGGRGTELSIARVEGGPGGIDPEVQVPLLVTVNFGGGGPEVTVLACPPAATLRAAAQRVAAYRAAAEDA